MEVLGERTNERGDGKETGEQRDRRMEKQSSRKLEELTNRRMNRQQRDRGTKTQKNEESDYQRKGQTNGRTERYNRRGPGGVSC
ncbi:hypothetical protein Pcinc_026798 [Petrolisthes cinctipes]|uniref:Uncharacterized protein n=1 Tax=Petrolisthes cinctipes TaxID=88211 RepID=A0AAE1F7J1_PETCI|nr:hypothetical protein Pcinc_026798 [Petrolisthes cinctipes]